MGQIHEYYFQPDAPDPILSEAEILRCVRKFVPHARAVNHIEESGGEGRTYIVDDEIVLKVQRPQQVRVSTSLAKEVFYLNQLAAFDSTLPVPRVLGYARESNLLEYNIQTRVRGVAVVNAELSPERGVTPSSLSGGCCAAFTPSRKSRFTRARTFPPTTSLPILKPD